VTAIAAEDLEAREAEINKKLKRLGVSANGNRPPERPDDYADASARVIEPAWSASQVKIKGDHFNALRFLDKHGDDVRFSPELGRFFVWNGSWWSEDRAEVALDLARRTVDGLREWASDAGDPDEFKRRVAHYTASTSASRREGLLNVARSIPGIVVTVDQLDTHPMLLACRNGTINLRTGELRPANRAHLITRGLNIDYVPDARSGLWESFIGDTFDGDPGLAGFVRRLFGSCLTGAGVDHLLPVVYGPGANGKTTMLGTIQDVMGEHAITAPEGLLTIQRHDPHPERIAVLRGRRLVVSYEMEQRANLAEQVVKALTGGDTVSEREMYGHRFDFKPTHHIVLVTNHRPRVNGTDHAIWRRLRLIPFTVTVPEDRRDRYLRQRLVAEHAKAVLAWLVAGAVTWCEQGLGDAPAVTAATNAYRQSEDVLGAFMAEMTETTEGTHTKLGELFELWKTWAERAGERPGRRNDFGTGLRDHGLDIRKLAKREMVLDLEIRSSHGD